MSTEDWRADATYWKNVLAGVSLTFAIIPTIVWGMRVYASHMVSKKLRVDDILMGVAVILMWGDTAAVLMKAFNGIGVPEQYLSEHESKMLNLGSWLIIKFWATSMACAKLSIIFFLRHLLGVTRRMRMTLDIMAVLVVCWSAVPFFYTIFFCSPVSYYWDKTIEGGSCVDNDLYMMESIIVGVLALVSDIVILIIPMPSIWKLQIKLKKKIAVTGILCVGGIVCIFSLLRVVQFAYFDTARLSTSSNLESLWTILENDFSILCGCLPQLKPLFRRYLGDTQNDSNLYYNSYAHQNSHAAAGQGFQKMGGVSTMVSGAHGGGPFRGEPATEARNSSEIELKGIEVHTTINHEVAHRTGDHDDQSQSSSSVAVAR